MNYVSRRAHTNAVTVVTAFWLVLSALAATAAADDTNVSGRKNLVEVLQVRSRTSFDPVFTRVDKTVPLASEQIGALGKSKAFLSREVPYWFEVDLGTEIPIDEIVLDFGGSAAASGLAVRVLTSTSLGTEAEDGSWTEVTSRAVGETAEGLMRRTFEAREAARLRVTVDGPRGTIASIYSLDVYEAAFAGNASDHLRPETAEFLSDSPYPYESGFGAVVIGPTDDGSAGPFPLGFAVNMYGRVFTQYWVNNNGNVTLSGPLYSYTPFAFPNTSGHVLIAPFFADVDTRPVETGLVYVNAETPGQIVVTWDRVGYYRMHGDKLNSFQLVIQDDITFGYTDGDHAGFIWGDLQWTSGDLSAGVQAAAGLDAGNGIDFAQVPGSFSADVLNWANTAAWYSLSGGVSGDPEPPVLAVIDGPPAGAHLAIASVAYTWTADDNLTPPDSLEFAFRLDAGEFSAWSLTSTASFAELPEGLHTFVIRARDRAGNIGTLSRTFGVDFTAPNTTVASGPSDNGWVNGESAVFCWGGQDNLTQPGQFYFSYSLDGGPFSAFAVDPCVTLRELTEAVHTVRAKCRDKAGHEDTTPLEVTFTVDNAPPNTVITAGPDEGAIIDTSTVTFVWTGADDKTPTGQLVYAYAVDGGAFSSYWSQATVTIPGLNDGVHVFAVKARDLAGNVDPTVASRSYIVDTAGPTMTIGVGPADGAHVAGRTVTFTWSGVDDATPADQLLYARSLDGAPFSAWAPETTVTIEGLSDGPHAFEVRGKNAYDHIGAVTRTFVVDVTPPTAQVVTGPSAGDCWPNSTVTLTWVAVDDYSASDAIVFSHRLDFGTFSAWTTARTITYPAQSAGPHVFELKARDRAGNEVPTAVAVSFVVGSNNLVAQAVTADAEALTGTSMDVSWHVDNRGDCPVSGSWSDTIYLSADAVAGGDTPLATTARAGPLAPGDGYDGTRSVPVPVVPGGTYWLVLRTDSAGGVFEEGAEDDNVAISQPITIVAPAMHVASSPISVVLNQDETRTQILVISNDGPGNLILDIAASAPWLRVVPGSITVSPGDTLAAQVSVDAGGLPPGAVSAQIVIGSNDPDLPQLTIPVQLTVVGLPPAVPAGPQPINGQLNVAAVPTLTWEASARALSYDLYLWPEGGGVPSAPTAAGLNSARYPAPSSLASGQTYAWKVVAHNGTGSTASPVWTFEVERIADIVVAGINLPPSAFSGQSVELSWLVENVGNEGTNVPVWTDAVYLSLDDRLDTGLDRLLGTAASVSFLPAGESYLSTHAFAIPQGIEGSYYVLVRADQGAQLRESDESNNTRCSAGQLEVQLTPPPDLQVSAVTGPGNAFSGQAVQVSWTVQNPGAGASRAGTWSDGVFLGDSPVLADAVLQPLAVVPHTGDLAPGEQYTVNRSVVLPQRLHGDYFIHVVADQANQVFEHVWEGNNRAASGAIVITLTPPPDLVVSLSTVPPTAASGESIEVTWSVTNQGAGTPYEAYWLDRVYLSSDAQVDTGDAILATLSRTGGLEPGQAYSRTTALVLPRGIAGEYNLLVVTDFDNRVFENELDGNNVSLPGPLSVSLSPWADLQVTAVDCAAASTAGAMIAIEWTVENRGTAATAPTTWRDRVYLSTSPTWPATGTVLKEIDHVGELAPGGRYVTEATIALPPDVVGNYYLHVVTDASSQVFEHADESNNVRTSGPISIDGYPPVDVAVVGVEIQTTAMSGQSTPIAWTVRNVGAARTLVNSWQDDIYLSADGMLDIAADTRLGTFVHTGALGPAESYSVSKMLVIPDGLEGNFRIIVRTSVTDALADNNFLAAATLLGITRSPYADLVVQTFLAPPVSPTAQPIEVQWTVGNEGDAAPAATFYDGLYLSSDPYIGAGDTKLVGTETSQVPGPGQSYTQSVTVNLPSYLSGSFYLIVKVDSRNDIYELDGEANNTAFAAITILSPQPADLVVGDIVVPAAAAPGEDVTISWTLSNQGSFPVTGWLTDAVYVSDDSTWEVEDPLVGNDVRIVSLEPGASVVMNSTVNFAKAKLANENGDVVEDLPGLTPGDYFAIVRTDIRDQIREVDDSNNERSSAVATSVSVPEIFLDVSEAASLAPGDMKYYRIDVPAGIDLRIALSGNVPDAANELYVAFDRAPTLGNFDYASAEPFRSDQDLIVPGTHSGTYYIMVLARSITAALEDVTILAEGQSFSVTGISPAAGGRGGRVTCTIAGAGFEIGATVHLRSAAGLIVPAEILEYVSRVELRVRWDLATVGLGVFDVVVDNPGGGTSVLNGSFGVEPLVTDHVGHSIVGAATVRAGQSPTYDIFVENGNNVDADFIVLSLFVPGRQHIRLETEDFFAWPVPEEFVGFEGLSAGMNWGGIGAMFMYAKNVAVGETVRARLQAFGVTGNDLPIVVHATAMSRDEFLRRQLIGLGAARQMILEMDPRMVAPEVVALLMRDDSLGEFQDYLRSSGVLDDRVRKPPYGLRLEYDPHEAPVIENGESGVVGVDPDCERMIATMTMGFRTVGLASSVLVSVATGAFFVANPWFAVATTLLSVTSWAVAATNDYCDFNDCSESVDTVRSWVGFDVLSWASAGISFVRGSPLGLYAGIIDANRDMLCTRVINSVDPNDIAGPVGSGEERWVSGNQSLPYTIHFENDPVSATSTAQVVRIRVPLDPGLNGQSFRLGRFGFANRVFEVPDNRSFHTARLDVRESMGLFVDVTAGIDVVANEAFWVFASIDPATGQPTTDVLAGFLAVNDSTGNGEGFVSYTVQPRSGVASGGLVRAEARIVFDANDPVDTAPTFNTLDAVPPTSRVVAAIAHSGPDSVRVGWSGSDDAGGSGLATFDIYVKTQLGSYTPWMVATTDTTGVFGGSSGEVYSFYSVATDRAGLREPAPDTPDTVVVIGSARPRFLAALPGVSFSEDDSLVVAISAWYPLVEDGDDPDSTLTWRIRGGRSVTAQTRAGEVVLGASRNWCGRDTLTVVVSDTSALADSTAWIVDVVPVNDAPELAMPTRIELGADEFVFVLPLDDFVFDPDNPDSTLNWATSGWDGLDVTVDEDARTVIISHAGTPGTFSGIMRVCDPAAACAEDTLHVVVNGSVATIFRNVAARYVDGNVLVEWQISISATGSYHIYRAESPDGPWARRTAEPLPAESSAFVDAAFNWGTRYWYRVALVVDGREIQSGEVDLLLPRLELKLGQSYPNPFNASTAIEYEVPRGGNVRIAIYSVDGHLVRTLVDEVKPAGRYRCLWDGRDNKGRALASGLYLYTLRADDRVLRMRMQLLK